MSTLIGLVGAVVGFGIIVAIHELGHFLGGLITKSAMDEFSIGMGTKIYGKMLGGMQFNLRLFPLGGFVKFATLKEDEEANYHPPESTTSNTGTHTKRSSNSYLENKNPWQRLLVYSMGPAFSMVLCPICFLLVFMHIGASQVSIVSLETGSPASLAGLKPGDTIVSLNGKKVTGAALFAVKVATTKPGSLLKIETLRDKETESIVLSPFSKEGKVMIGAILREERVPVSFKNAGKEAILHSMNLTN